MNKPLFSLTIAAVAAALALGWWYVNAWHYSNVKTETRLQVTTEILPYKKALCEQIRHHFALLDGLHAFTKSLSREEISEAFPSFAKDLFESEEGLRNVTIAPGGVQTFVYPLEDNEEVPGHDLREDPREEVRQDVEKAISSRDIVVSGPYELRQGGQGLVIRKAVFKNEQFWGLVALVVDMPPMYEKSGLSGSDEYELMLTGTGGEVFWGSPELEEENPAMVSLDIAGEEWSLSAVPSAGWERQYRRNAAAFSIATAIITVLVFLGLVYLIRKLFSLSVQVREEEERNRNRLLMYKNAIDSSQELIAAMDTDYRYLFANTMYLKQYRLNEEQVVGTHVRELLGEEAFFSTTKPQMDVALAGTPVSYDMRREFPAGGKMDVSVSYYPLRDNKKVIGLVAVIRDITERKEYEWGLQKTLERKKWLNEFAASYLRSEKVESVIQSAVDELGRIFSDLRVAYSAIGSDGVLTVQYATQPEGMPDITSLKADLNSAPEYLHSLRTNPKTIIHDVEKDERVASIREALRAGNTRAVVDIAVMHEERLEGLLCFDAPTPREWSEHEIATVEEHVNLFSLMLSNERYQKKHEEMQAILQAAMDQSQAGIVVADFPDGTVRYMNTAGLEISGEDEESLEEHIDVEDYVRTWNMFHLDGTPYTKEDVPLSRAVLFGETCSDTCILGTDKKTIIWANAAPILNQKGERIGGIAVFLDITETRENEERLVQEQQNLERVVEEKETLLKEIHHRVKNNLNVVVSLLKLQENEISSIADAQEALEESSKRIYSMALVHESLYKSESLSEVEMDSYIRTMVGQLQYSTPGAENIDFSLDLDAVQLEIIKAVPCGIIVNELITNAQKHAFPDSAGGTITVSCKSEGEGGVSLTVEDNGVGLPPDFEVDTTSTLGFSLIRILTQQIDGELEYETRDGASFTVRFSLQED